MITVVRRPQALRRLRRPRRRHARHPRGLAHRAARAERVGQVDAAARRSPGSSSSTAGAIVIGGADVTGSPPQKRGIGFVFQHYAAFKHMTVRDNVAFGLTIRKRPKAEIARKVDDLLEIVGLDGFQHRYPAQLSGGQRQRMALARALAVDPEVLLLDEPFGALDAKVRADLRQWLRRLHDEVHVTTVLVTHDQEEALDVADRIAVLNKGRIEQVGDPVTLYDRPGQRLRDVVPRARWPGSGPAGPAARHRPRPQP